MSVVATVGASGVEVVYIVSLLTILFMFTRENGLVCSFPPGGGIWASGTIVEAAATEVGAGAAPEETAANGLSSLLRETVWLVALSRASTFVLFAFYIYCSCCLFLLAYLLLSRCQLQTSFYPKKRNKELGGGGYF